MTGPVIDETAADLAALGVATAALPEKEAPSFDVFPENWDAVRCFCACSTQWRQSFSGITGIDYTVLFKIIEIYSIDDTVNTFEDVRIMEAAVLQETSRERKKA